MPCSFLHKGVKNMGDNIHAGHRRRMRQRFLETGFAGFPPHEVLEMLLYYGIPRRDTNPLAHKLLAEYGSLHSVLCADPEELKQFPGMSESAAVLLAMVRELYAYDAAAEITGAEMSDFRKICSYFKELYQYEEREIVRVALLDEHLRLIRIPAVAEGQPSAAQISVRRITEAAIRAGCNTIILVHNHPRGSAKISAEDAAVTRELSRILHQFDIRLVDHIVVGCGEAVSMREYGVFIGTE